MAPTLKTKQDTGIECILQSMISAMNFKFKYKRDMIIVYKRTKEKIK